MYSCSLDQDDPVGFRMDSGFMSRREKILRLLREARQGITAEEIGEVLGIHDMKTIYVDLERISKSIKAKHRQERLGMVPPVCKVCGFVFTAKKPKKPSKCPKCRSERIKSPIFSILSRSKQKKGKS
jgi:predicted Zn-ribbon and HTH transcriptional regulator